MIKISGRTERLFKARDAALSEAEAEEILKTGDRRIDIAPRCWGAHDARIGFKIAYVGETPIMFLYTDGSRYVSKPARYIRIERATERAMTALTNELIEGVPSAEWMYYGWWNLFPSFTENEREIMRFGLP